MDALIARLATQAAAWSLPEIVAVAAAIGYLVLAIRQHIACWVFALLSTGIYMTLFIEARLYMESVLNLFYFAMAIYGWYAWHDRGRGERVVSTRPAGFHAAAIGWLAALAAVNGWLLARFTDAAFPYLDALTTWSAIFATWLVARKILENWWYWLAIDTVSVFIYWSRGLELTALLFVFYLLLIPVGYLSWRRGCRASV